MPTLSDTPSDRRIENDEYELYDSNLDTTFCLINNKYKGVNKCSGIRVAGNFTAKHLPWYKDYSKNNIPQDETDFYKKNNVSSSIINQFQLY